MLLILGGVVKDIGQAGSKISGGVSDFVSGAKESITENPLANAATLGVASQVQGAKEVLARDPKKKKKKKQKKDTKQQAEKRRKQDEQEVEEKRRKEELRLQESQTETILTQRPSRSASGLGGGGRSSVLGSSQTGLSGRTITGLS